MPDRSTTPLRKLMRETVLHVALIAGGAQMPALHFWRARCITLVEELMQAMRDAGYREAEVDEASLAQCVLLDDVTLRALPPARRNEWTRELLQVRFHDTRDGAATVRTRIDRALRGSARSPDLLELYRILLEPGFLEEARNDRQARRERAGKALATIWRNENPELALPPGDMVSEYGRKKGRQRRRLPWLEVLLLSGAAAVWFAADRHVDRALMSLTGEQPAQTEPAAGEVR